MKAIPFALALLLAVSAFAQELPDKANPGSLYGPNAESNLLDRIARKPGDILTILVDEQSLSTYAADTSASKNDSSRVGVSFFIDFLDDLFKPLTTGVSANSQVNGQGETSQTARMSARLSATVKEVLPNGTMIIEGRRTLVTNKETQTLLLKGTIRAQDIRPYNTIRSAQIADASIQMTGEGLIQDRQRKGILTTLLDWIF